MVILNSPLNVPRPVKALEICQQLGSGLDSCDQFVPVSEAL